MSGSTAREARKNATTTRETISLGDLTLDELDEVEQLKADGKCGRTTAVAYVVRRRKNPAYTIDQAKALTLREVHVVDDIDDGEAVADTPTTAP